jgi:putative DNA primase/helicase
MTAGHIAQTLRGRRSGAGWTCYCPVHEADGRPHQPSLSVSEKNGKVLVKCFAGCDQNAVVAALKDRGLWPESERREYPEDWGRLVCTYDYTDEDGKLLYQVCRFEPKKFRPRRPDGIGGWKWGLKGVRRVPYHLPELLEAPIVFITEGEKDAETLREWGFVATTNAFGADGWRPEFYEYFRNREVIIIPDYDVPGFERAGVIARGLTGIATRICVLSELTFRDPKHKDITDWFAEGHSELELIELVERDLPKEAANGN